ncbi:Clo7bot family Cys-rich peptide [Caloranaerobacter ferrireducens]
MKFIIKPNTLFHHGYCYCNKCDYKCYDQCTIHA